MNQSKLGKTLNLIVVILLTLLGVGSILISYLLNENLTKFWNYFLTILGAILLLTGLLFLHRLTKKEGNKLSVKQMSMVAIMSAITVILYYFVKFNLPFFPPWLDIQVSEIPAMITGFAYGPFAGCMVILVRFVLKLPATITGGVGELADLVLGVVVVGLSSIIYRKNKTLKGAFLGTGVGIFSALVLSCFINWLVLIPAYIYIAGFPLEALVGMMNSYLPFEVTADNFMLTYIFIGVLPFNLFRFILVFIFTFLLYKSTHRLLKRLTR